MDWFDDMIDKSKRANLRGIASGRINGLVKAQDVRVAEQRGAFSIKNVFILKSFRALKALRESVENPNG